MSDSLGEKENIENITHTESQPQDLEKTETKKKAQREIEIGFPGYLGVQDTFYVRTLKGVGRIYQQIFIDSYTKFTFVKLYVYKTSQVAADILYDMVLPFFEQEGIRLLGVLTDREPEFSGSPDHHEYELCLEIEDINHSKTKARHQPSNGICAYFHRIIQEEFYHVVFQSKIYHSVEELQADLDQWLWQYNHEGKQTGEDLFERPPYQTFQETKYLARQKLLEISIPTPVSQPEPVSRELPLKPRLYQLISLFSRSKWVAPGYLILLVIAESLVALGKPQPGLILHGVILAVLLLHASLENRLSQRQFLLALSLAPLIRLLSLLLPLTLFPVFYWYLVVGMPLFVAAFLIMRQVGITRQMAGLVPGKYPMQILIGCSGFFLGYIEYRILRPAPLVPALRWETVWLAALILLIFTGLLEEFIFRGLQQSTALPVLGRYAIPYVAAVFAVLHFGYRSGLDVLFVFGVALFFGWIVQRSGSILGVSVSHGLTNISLYLIFPLLMARPDVPQGFLPPLRFDSHAFANSAITQKPSTGLLSVDTGTILIRWPRQVSAYNSSTADKFPTDLWNAPTLTKALLQVNLADLNFIAPLLVRPPPL